MEDEKRLVDLLHKGVRCPGTVDDCAGCPHHSWEVPCDAFGATASMLINNDVVPVVRCGKCKWYDPDSEYCQFWHGCRHPGHYCGEGEKKDG
jgi:hypothetical protein